MISLLPDVSGLRVLDAGCGTGILAEILLERGAQVMAFDYNAEFFQRARKRLGSRAAVPGRSLAAADLCLGRRF